MKALEILFNRRWVLKSEDKDLYYQIRDAVGGYVSTQQKNSAARLLIIRC